MGPIIQKLIRWMPIVLFVLLLMVDRDNTIHVVGFICLLLAYTTILVMRILYAKEEWHRDFDSGDLGQNSSIKKMSDLKDKLEEQNEFDSKS